MASGQMELQQNPSSDGNGSADFSLAVVEPAPAGSRWAQAHRILLLFLLAAVVIWLLNGFYSVGVGEVAVIDRLGQWVSGPDNKPLVVQTGLRYCLPWPIDKVYIVPEGRTQTLQITDFNRSPAAYAAFEKVLLQQGMRKRDINAIYKPYLVTADKNVLHCQVMLQYLIRNPVDYLTSVYESPAQRNGQGRTAMIVQLAAHELIDKVAQTPVDAALFYGRQELENSLYDHMAKPAGGAQAVMTALHMGIQVQKVHIEFIRWPRNENPAFQGVLNAQQQENVAIQDARKYAIRKETIAAGQAQAILNSARAYADRVEQHATGEANEFGQVYAEYRQHPRTVRLSLYTSTVDSVLNSVTRVFYVQPNQHVSLVLRPPPRNIQAPRRVPSLPPPGQ